MLPAVPAEFLDFQALRGGLLVLGGRIVAILALGALEGDDVARHLENSYILNRLCRDSVQEAGAKNGAAGR
jgi:hypothetical protein